VHDASVLNPLFGAAPLEVTAMAAVQVAWNNSAAADSVLSVLRYPDGSAGTDRLAFADDSFKIAACSYHEILGDQGAIIIRDAMNQDTAGAVELHTPPALHQSTSVTSPGAAWSRLSRPTRSPQGRCSTPIRSGFRFWRTTTWTCSLSTSTTSTRVTALGVSQRRSGTKLAPVTR
jgi:predicted dehydrogenase